MYQQPTLLYPDIPTSALYPIYSLSPFALPLSRVPDNYLNTNNLNNLNNLKNLKFTTSIDAEVERAYGCVLKLNLSKFPFLKGATISIRSNCVDKDKVVKRANKVGKTPQQSDYELDAWIEVEHFNYNYIGSGDGIGIRDSDISNGAEEDGISSSSRTTREILKNCCSEKCKDHTNGIAFFRTFAFVVGQSNNNAMEEELPMIFYGAPSHDRRGKKAKFILRMKLYENGVVLSESEDLVVPYKQSITVKQRNQQGNQQQQQSPQQMPKPKKIKTPKKEREAEGEQGERGEGRKKSRRHHNRVRSHLDDSFHQIPKKRRKTGLRSEVPTGEDENSDINSPLMQSTPSSPSLSPHEKENEKDSREKEEEHRAHRGKNSSFRTLSRCPPSQQLPYQPPSSSSSSSFHPSYHLDLLAALSTNYNTTISPNNSFGSLSPSCNNSFNGNVMVSNNSSGHYIIGNNSSSSDSAWSTPSRLEAPVSYPSVVPHSLLPSPYPAQYDLSDLLVHLAEYQLIAPFSQFQSHLLNHYFTNQSNNHIGGANLNLPHPFQYLEPQHHHQQQQQQQPSQRLALPELSNQNLNLNHPNSIPHQIPLEQIPSQICNSNFHRDTLPSTKSISSQISHSQSQGQQSNPSTVGKPSSDFHGAFSVAHLLRSRSQ